MAIDLIKRKKGVSWRSRLLLDSGKRISKCFIRKQDAIAWEAERLLEHNRGFTSIAQPIRMNELADKVLSLTKHELQPATYEKYEGVIRLHVIPFFKDRDLCKIKKLDVLEFKNIIQQSSLSASSKNFVFTTARMLFKKGIMYDLLLNDPFVGIPHPKKRAGNMNYWESHEAETFLERMQGHIRYSLYLLAVNTGLRVGELFGLQWDCVDFDKKILNIKRTFDQKTGQSKETTKTHKTRFVGLNDVCLAILRELKAKSNSVRVFDLDAIKCRNSCHIARIFRSDCKSVGVRPIRFHDLRHTFATQAVRITGNIHAVSNLLGHRTTSMTERYAHFSPDHAVNLADQISIKPTETATIIPIRA